MSIEEDIRDAVAPPVAWGSRTTGSDTDYLALRAHVRGTLIDAHRRLVVVDKGLLPTWEPTDDKILDIVSAWIEQLRGRH